MYFLPLSSLRSFFLSKAYNIRKKSTRLDIYHTLNYQYLKAKNQAIFNDFIIHFTIQ
jgi:hypothetical protein